MELEIKESKDSVDSRKINYLHLVSVEDNLDKLLGFYYWKRYIAAAFWSNISTPINLAITLMTAMTTAQATTLNLFSNSITSTISIITFALTVVNTFFKPHLQMTQNITIMEQWNSVGVDFELIFYDNNKYNEYYRECKNEDDMSTVETMVLSKLHAFREQANRDRFILPEDRDVSFFTQTIDECIRFLA